jgi:3'(2'), 5'-bisphosphate nucleotidase
VDVAACAGWIDGLTTIALRASLVIRATAATAGVRRKPDGSPVTAADEAAEAAICEGLARLAPGLPVISEEQAEPLRPPVAGSGYFLVDPLDGTREFAAGRDEYTVNIALMSNGAPIVGIVAAPALGLIWRGIVGRGAERMAFAADGTLGPPLPIQARKRPRDVIVLVSRSHLDAGTQAFVSRLPRSRTAQAGSSLKFCRIAEGTADLYPRLAPTHDWDVAAGHALLEAAGGTVRTPDEKPLLYGTAELLIPGFVASGNPAAE